MVKAVAAQRCVSSLDIAGTLLYYLGLLKAMRSVIIPQIKRPIHGNSGLRHIVRLLFGKDHFIILSAQTLIGSVCIGNDFRSVACLSLF